MNRLPIALQLYSVKDDAKADFAGVLGRVKEMGYDGVEFAGLHGHAPEAVRAMCDDAGLKPYSAHVPIDQLKDDAWRSSLEIYRTIGCDTLIVPWLPPEHRADQDAWLRTADFFAQLDAKVRGAGGRTGFHAHWMEFTTLPNGMCGWDLIAMETPDTFIMQFDTANAMQGGADPVEPIRKHYHRAQLLHLKEYIRPAIGVDPVKGHALAALGDGGVPWEDVFAVAETDGGTEVYIVEQEGHPTLSPMDAAAKCAANLLDMLEARANATL